MQRKYFVSVVHITDMHQKKISLSNLQSIKNFQFFEKFQIIRPQIYELEDKQPFKLHLKNRKLQKIENYI